MTRTQVTGYDILDDSVKGIDINEQSLDATFIPFSDAGFLSLNIHSAIIEARENPDVSKLLIGYDSYSILTDCYGYILTEE